MQRLSNYDIKIFTGRAHPSLAEEIAAYLQLPMGRMNLGNFPDDEISVRIEEDVRGRDVYLIQPTCPPVNDNLMELLIMMDSFRRASAARITVVMPYYGYARQDRKDVGRVPITAKLVANLLTQAGAHRILTLDLHAAQIQGFFDIPVDHLLAAPVFIKYIRSLDISPQDIVVVDPGQKPEIRVSNIVMVSPDEGRIKLTLHFQKKIGGELAIVDKRRSSATETKQANLIGANLEGKKVLMFDDMISTAGSIVGAVHVAKHGGAKEIHVFATHAVLCGPAIQRLRDAPITKIVVTNSIPVPPDKQLPNLTVLSVAPLLGEAIKRLHSNDSVSRLFD
jgi:ribose-phosphate pyrophosphokinase